MAAVLGRTHGLLLSIATDRALGRRGVRRGWGMGARFGLGLCVGQSTVLAVDGRCAELQPQFGHPRSCQPVQPLVRAEHSMEIFPYGVLARMGVGLAPAVALRGQPLCRLAFVLNRVSTRKKPFPLFSCADRGRNPWAVHQEQGGVHVPANTAGAGGTHQGMRPCPFCCFSPTERSLCVPLLRSFRSLLALSPPLAAC